MKNIDLEALDEAYENVPTIERIPRKPVGSLTDNLRDIEPRRNALHKRVSRMRKERTDND